MFFTEQFTHLAPVKQKSWSVWGAVLSTEEDYRLQNSCNFLRRMRMVKEGNASCLDPFLSSACEEPALMPLGRMDVSPSHLERDSGLMTNGCLSYKIITNKEVVSVKPKWALEL